MKICKVKITKERNGSSTKFIYPASYDKNIISPFIYQNEGKDEEFCLAHVPDNFSFTTDMVEVDKTTAESTVSAWIDNDVDLQAAVAKEGNEVTEDTLVDIKAKKQALCDVS